MDVFKALLLKCSEYPVIVDGKKVPLREVSKKDIEEGRVDFRLWWKNLVDLAVYLYEIRGTLKKRGKFSGCPIDRILVGLAFLKSDGKNIGNPYNACIYYLTEIVMIRMQFANIWQSIGEKPPHANTLLDNILYEYLRDEYLKSKEEISKKIEWVVEKIRNLEFDI